MLRELKLFNYFFASDFTIFFSLMDGWLREQEQESRPVHWIIQQIPATAETRPGPKQAGAQPSEPSLLLPRNCSSQKVESGASYPAKALQHAIRVPELVSVLTTRLTPAARRFMPTPKLDGHTRSPSLACARIPPMALLQNGILPLLGTCKDEISLTGCP